MEDYNGLSMDVGAAEEQAARIRDLEKDLAEAIDLSNRLREENESYRINFDNLKVAHLQLQNKHGDVRRQLGDAVEANRHLEATHLEVTQHLQAQLETLTREHEEMMETALPGRELERMRAKIIAEVEKDHQKKLRKTAEAAEQNRTALTMARRELADVVERTTQERGELEKVIRELEDKLRDQEESSKARIKVLQDCVDELRKNEPKLMALKKENLELQERHKQAVVELDEIHARLEKAHQEAVLEARSRDRQLSEERSGVRALLTEKEALDRKVSTLQQQLLEEGLARERQAQQIAVLEQQQTHSRSQFSTANQSLQAELERMSSGFGEERQRWRKERELLLKQVDESKMRLEEVVQREQGSVAQMLAREKQSAQEARAALDAATTSLSQLHKALTLITHYGADVPRLQDRAALEHRLVEAEQGRMEMETQYQREIETLRDELSSNKGRMGTTTAEAQVLEEKLRKLDAEYGALAEELRKKTQQLDTVVSENMKQATQLEDENRTLSEQLAQTEESLQNYVQVNDELKAQLCELTRVRTSFTERTSND
eukprot:m51a1_g5117 hypothetical protein (550) ;mRNA; r:361639-364049